MEDAKTKLEENLVKVVKQNLQAVDPAQYHLVGEVNEINQSIDALKQKLNDAQNSLKDLQDNRMALEKEIVRRRTAFSLIGQMSKLSELLSSSVWISKLRRTL
ncbi:Tektin-4 [Bulinus truncatus]|nr:Tektin-4 [Bulinus truncatus]